MCLKESIHANLLLQIISSQPAEKFLSLFNSIYRRKSIKWLASQCQSVITVKPETVKLVKTKILAIIGELATNMAQQNVSTAQVALEVWCILSTVCNIRFALNDAPPLLALFESTKELKINRQSKQLICTCAAISLAYGDFSTPAKPQGFNIDNQSRLSTWFHQLVTRINDEADVCGYQGEVGSLAEFFLILSIHFHYEEKTQLEQVVKRNEIY